MMVRAFIEFSLRSAKNRILQRLRRLRQPRYLMSLLFGLAYFGWLIFGQGRGGPRHGHGVFRFDGRTVNDLGGLDMLAFTVIAWVVMLFAWAFPSSTAGITFTEAEIQFLFPAPLRRWHLLLYRVIRSQPGLLFTSIIFSLFVFRSSRFVGIWIALIVLQIYLMMVAFARARLRLMGIGFLSRLVAVLIAFGATVALVVQHFRMTGFRAVVDAFNAQQLPEAARLLREGLLYAPAGVMLWIPSLIVRPATSTTLTGMAAWIPVVFGMGLVFFVLASRIDVSFEDASIVKSQKKVKRLEEQRQQQTGRRVLMRSMPAPFKLRESGRPEIAILWKNLIAGGRMSLPIFLGLTVAVLLLTAILYFAAGPAAAIGVGSSFSLIALAVLTGVGPLIFRNDLRTDLEQVDVLKMLPVSGFRMVLAQIASPTVIVFSFQMLFLLLAISYGAVAFLVPAPHPPFETWILWLSWVPAALILVVPVDLLQTMFQNAIVILLPGWASMTREQAKGIEGMGRGILLMLGHLLILALGLIPAALVFLIVFWLSSFLFGYGPASGTIAAIPASMLLSFELYLAVRFLGSQFEEIDIANDLQLGTGGH